LIETFTISQSVLSNIIRFYYKALRVSLVPVIASILILGTLGLSQDAFADPLTLFPTFVDSFSVAAQVTDPRGLAFSSDGAKMFVVGRIGLDINEYTLGTAFDVSTASFVDSFSVAAQAPSPRGLAFNSDGTKMFVVDPIVDAVNEYTLTTGFDVSTASFVDSFSVGGQDVSPQDVAFSSDGTKMFVVGSDGDDINEYTLATPFDVSTASFVDSFSVAAQETAPTGVAFSSDGAKMFVAGNIGDDINEYTLGTAFDVSTASFVDSFSVKAQEIGPLSLAFSSDGAKMFVVGNVGDAVYEYTLNNAFTLFPTFVDSFSVAGQDTNPLGLAFSSDGAKMFVVGSIGNDVNEYTLTTPFDVSTASFVDSFSVAGQETGPAGLAFSSDGTKMFVVGTSGVDVNEYTLTTPFDVSTASFVDSFSVTAQEINPQGLAFSSDGGKMFVLGAVGDDVNEYTLTTPFDVSTASFVDSFSVAAQDTLPVSLAFSSDGTKMFVVGFVGRDINEYTLTTPFDVSTASFVDSFSVAAQDTAPRGVAFSSDGAKMFVVGTVGDAVNEYNIASIDPAFVDPLTLFPTFVDSFSVVAQETLPTGLAFSLDGAKMFVVGLSGDDVNEYTLATPFDVSTASFVDSFSVAAQETAPTDVAFSSDGTKMFVVGFTGLDINEYTLATPFDVSTASFVDSFSVAAQDPDPRGLAFSSDGTKMFVVGNSGDAVFEYTLATPFDVSTASFVVSFSVAAQDPSPRGLAFSSDGTKMFVLGSSGDDVNEYTLSTAFDVSTASFVVSFSVAAQETSPQGLAFSSDGTKMFVVGITGDDVDEYTLINAFTLFPTFVDSFSVAAQDTLPVSLAFSSDGTKMFVLGNTGDDINEYTLTTPFDVSTASFVDSFSVAAQEIFPRGLAFSSDGTKMFVVGNEGDDVNEYTLTTGFDVSTASFVDSFSVAAQETTPTDVAFSSDGTKMFVVGFTGDDVNKYTLTTPFDVSTASFADSFSVAAQETLPTDVAFSSDGAKMFVVGDSGDDVNEYTLTTPFDVSTASFVDSFSVAAQEISPQGLAFSADGAKMFVLGFDGSAVNEYNITSITPSCSPPPSGDWVVDSSCAMTSGATINNGDLIVRNNSVLTVPFTLDIDFLSHNITVESGSGVLIKAGGKIT